MLAATLAVIVLTVALFGVLTLAHRTPGSPAKVLDRSKIGLSHLSMVSASEGWAIGNMNGQDYQGVILHYHNGQWHWVADPYDAGILSSIFMVSATDGWIVSYKGIILHYTGGRWVKVPSPVTSALGSVSMVSPTEGWAMGYSILHYQQGVWTQVSDPAPTSFIYSIAMRSHDEGWAVGNTIMHYTAGQWQVVPGPDISPHLTLFDVAMVASTVGWAVSFGNGMNANLLQYQDGVWSVADSPVPQETLWSIAMASPEEGWIVGFTHQDAGLILHYQHGQWTSVPSPTHDPLEGITLVSPTEGWAVGSFGAILHYRNGTWSSYTDAIPLESTSPAPAGINLSL